MITLDSILIGAGIILIASFVQGLTSFGFALIALPLLSLLMPIQRVVPIIVILSMLICLSILCSVYRDTNIRKIWLLIVASVITAPLGTLFLLIVSGNVLKIITGILITIFAVFLLSGRSIPIANEKVAYISAGALSGLLSGSISVSGPPMALMLSNQGMSKQMFRANLALVGVILNGVTAITFVYSGLVDQELSVYLLWMLPVMLIGAWIGAKAVRRLNEQKFKTYSLGLIILSGIWTLLAGLGVI